MKYNRLKRTVSGLLASAMLMAYSSAAITYAADAYNIKFIEENSATTTVIEGGVVNAKAVLPLDHVFDTEKPFTVRFENATAAPDGLIAIATSGSANYYAITANAGSAKGELQPPAAPNDVAERTYSLVPRLTANLTDGEGDVNVQAGTVSTSPPGTPPADQIFTPAAYYSMKVKSKAILPITTPSSFTFKAMADETNDGKGNGTILFSKVTAGVGEFSGLFTPTPLPVALQTPVITQGGQKIIKIKVDKYELDMSIAMPSNMIITKDTEFTVNYRMQEINPLILHVVSPQWAVNTTAKSIQSNPLDPLVPDGSKTPYIGLASGDTLSSITTNFKVLSRVKRYNSKDPNQLHIKWKWVPDKEYTDSQNVVDFGMDTAPTWSVTLNPRLGDVKGKLVATVDYLPVGKNVRVEALPVDIPVTILGTGIPPKLQPLTQTVGQTAPAQITSVPRNMDVYDGKILDPNLPKPTHPYIFTGKMIFGTGRGRAEKTIIRAVGVTPDAVKLYIDNSPIPYDFGTDIINTDTTAGQKQMTFQATKSGMVTLYFDYYVKDNKGKLVMADSSEQFTITVSDTTPSDFAQLFSLGLQSPALAKPPVAGYPGGAISYGFKSDNYLYANIEIPFLADTINITPSVTQNQSMETDIKYEIVGGGNTGLGATTGTVVSGEVLGGQPIPMHVESKRTITLTVTAQSGKEQLYILTINRMPPDRTSSLKNLTVTDGDGGAILKGFSPTQTEYTATVPYRTRWAKFVTEKGNPWATEKYSIELIEKPPVSFSEKNWIRLKYFGDKSDGEEFNGPSNITEQKITVVAQDNKSLYPDGSYMYTTTYSVKIIRAAPSTNVLVSTLTIKDNKDRPVNFDGGKKFDKNDKDYGVHIPYSTDKITLSMLPDDVLAESIIVEHPDGTPTTLPYAGGSVPLNFVLDTPMGDKIQMNFKISFKVKSEAGGFTDPPYVINVVRNDPDLDDTLTSLEVKDQNDADVKKFSFNPQTTLYDFSVPFETEQIRVTPKPRSVLATVKVNGEVIDAKKPYYITLIKPGETKNIKVEIFPEDIKATPRVYEMTITRDLPSTDARLKDLTIAGGEGFTPRFVPNTTIYGVKIPEGTKSITFTATPLGVGSTMTLNGETLPAAKPSSPYEPYETKTVVHIVVTAQDGKTKMTYTINVSNQNLVPKSGDADLVSLDITEGSMSPRFKAGVTDYEVAVKDDITAVDILPIPRSEYASIKVFADSRELGDYYDRYATAIPDGETTITVEVTAENGKTKKTYEVIVYRKDEEKQGTYKPITADMVNYTTNPIVVDISRYTVIAAEVLNTLKEKHPEKTMVFEGNDYSLQITGKDIATLIPHTTTFDLGITFSSPNEDDIWRFILDHPRNDTIEPVFIHFNHHGVLPGKMLFTVSLGRNYRTENATWNYYNEERKRIDYYGGVRSNSRGTFTVPITHMSTYIYCKDRIDGAENKSGDLGNVGNQTGSSGVTKPNPNTVVGGAK